MRALLLRPAVGAAAWFVLLAVAVAGPLLGPGTLLLLDFPSGPHFPRAWPFDEAGDFGDATPIAVVHALLREIHPLLAEKAFLLAPVAVGGLGAFRLAGRMLHAAPGAALFGGTFFAVNPFVADRYLAGHLYFLLAYALLPWAVSSLLAAADARGFVRVGLWAAALAGVSLHVAGAFAVVAVLMLALVPGLRNTAGLGAAAATAGAVTALWVVPALLAFGAGASASAAEVAEYAARPRGLPALPALAALEGFWRDEFRRPTATAPALYALLAPLLVLAAAGTVVLVRSRLRRLGIALALAAPVGVLLAATTALPGGPAWFAGAADALPPLAVYREPQKLLSLTVLAYSLLAAAGLSAALAVLRSRPRLAALGTTAAVAVTLGFGHGMLFGLGGDVSLVQYPASWRAAARVVEGEGRLLSVPPVPYAVWSFSDGRIVANPARSFFAADVVGRRGPGFPGVPDSGFDDVERALRGPRGGLARALATLDVRYVALLHEEDWPRYEFVAATRGLVRRYSGGGIAVFENEAWRAGARAGTPAAGPVDRAGAAVSVLAPASSRQRRVAAALAGVRPPLISSVTSAGPRGVATAS